MTDPGRTITAVVFDSNVFGKAVEPNIELIDRWADACHRHDAELWIPEPVALELAERAVRASREHSDVVTSYNLRRKRWGLAAVEIPPTVTVEEIRRQITRHGAEIIEVSGQVAQAALRDQILGEGPGSTKAGVKTGASDSAWARAVIEHNGGDDSGLIIVTGDHGAACFLIDELDVSRETIVANTGQIRELLDEQTTASAELVQEFVEALPDNPDESIWLVDEAEIDDQWRARRPARGLSPDRFEIQDRTYTLEGPPRLLSTVEYDAWSRSLTGRVEWVLTVQEQYVDLDSDEATIVDNFSEFTVVGDVAVMYDDELSGWTWAEFGDAQVHFDGSRPR